MTNVAEFNAAAFDRAAEAIRALGHHVFSPVECNRECGYDFAGFHGTLDELEAVGFSLDDTMRRNLGWLVADGEAIALLPRWANSYGARIEVIMARALGLIVYEYREARRDPLVQIACDVRHNVDLIEVV